MRQPPRFLFHGVGLPKKYSNVGGAFGSTVRNTEALSMTYANLLASAKADVVDMIRRKQRAIDQEVRAVQRRNAAALKPHANLNTLGYYGYKKLPASYNSPTWTNAEISALAGIIRQQGKESIDRNRTNYASYAKRRALQSYKVLKPKPFLARFRSSKGGMNNISWDSRGYPVTRPTAADLRARDALVKKKRPSPTGRRLPPRRRFFGLF